MRTGDLHLHPVSDGTFVATPSYFGDHVAPSAHPELFDRHGAAWLPLGCFLLRAGDRLVLLRQGGGVPEHIRASSATRSPLSATPPDRCLLSQSCGPNEPLVARVWREVRASPAVHRGHRRPNGSGRGCRSIS